MVVVCCKIALSYYQDQPHKLFRYYQVTEHFHFWLLIVYSPGLVNLDGSFTKCYFK